MGKVAETLRDSLASIVEGLNYEFVGCEIQGQGRHAVLRIYIDSENGITIDDCSKVSYQVSAMLDVEDPVRGQHALEISSPGIDRPLFELSHFEKFIGNRVKVRVCAPIHNRKKFDGVLLRVEGDEIHLLVDAEEIVLPFSDIERANVIADIR